MKLAISKKNMWEALPAPLKSLAGRLIGLVPLGYVFGKQYRNTYAFLHDSQWWSEEQIRRYQLQKLVEICAHAYRNSGFYRKQFDDAGFHPDEFTDLGQFSNLPIISKETLLRHSEDMLTVPADDRNVDLVSTGGTSGMPMQFYIGSNRSAIEYAYLVSSWSRAGYRLGDTMAVFRGRVVEADRNGLRHEYDPLLRHHYYSNFHMTEENMGRYINHVATLGSCYLHVYPSSVAALARYLKTSGMAAPGNIRGIIAESEIIYDDQRKLAEEVFGTRYFSCYGHTEKLVCASECEHSSDYHVWPTYGYFELIDKHGKAVTTPGERGEIVGTGFINKAMPFIRYRTGDFATYVSDHCEACGRNHPVIRDIQGHRTQEYLIASDGAEISWTSLNMHDDTFDNVRQFQFYQDQPGVAELKIVPAGRFTDTDQVRIQENMGRKFDDRLNFTIRVVEEIKLTRMGKSVYVDQHIKKDNS